MSRIITIISTQGDSRVELDSSSTTWSQLEVEINREGTFSTGGHTAMVRGTRQVLSNGTDILPSSEFTLFFTPSKIKSGGYTN